MNEKHQEVRLWLDRVYAGEAIPSYEINTRTIEVLHRLMRKNEKKERDMQLVIDDYRQKSEEYSVEGKRIFGILQSLNLTSASLSQAGVMSLRTLANLALLLEVKDTSDTSYLLALQNLFDEANSTADARQLEQRTINKLIERTRAELVKYNSLKKAVETLKIQSVQQRPDIEKKAKQCGFLQSKCKEYRLQIQQLLSRLKACEADPNLYHQELVRKSEELQKLKDQIVPLKTKLQTYHSLPPDISLAKVKVEEIRQQLADIEKELSHKMDLAHM